MLSRVIFILFLFLCSCSRYSAGTVYATNNEYGTDFLSFFNYNVIDKNNIIVQAKIDGRDYYGNVINIKDRRAGGRKYSVIRMQSREGILIQCFNELKSSDNFAKGGKGTCYERGNRLFDILIQPAQSYMSINFLRAFVE